MEDLAIPLNQYKPSGKISLLRFSPLFIFSFIISVIMAFVLLFLEANYYYIFITPFLVSLPVFGVIFMLIHFGRCRNPFFGALTGLFLAAIYYVGYWELSYLDNVVFNGDQAVEYVRVKGGSPGLLGYFRFRCGTVALTDDTPGSQTDYKPPTSMDVVFNYVFYSVELLGILVGCFFLGLFLSKRIFYERFKKWASSLKLRLRPDKIPEIVRSIKESDWASLAAIPRLPKMVIASHKTPFLELKIEYLKKYADQSMYLTLSGSNLGHVPEARQMAKGFKGIHLNFFRQIMIPPQSAAILSSQFPELKMPPSSLLQKADSVSKAEATMEPDKQGLVITNKSQIPVPSQDILSIPQSQFASLETSNVDFREKADDISARIVNREGSFVNIIDINRSLCLPVDEDDVIQVKLFLRRFGITMTIIVVLSFGIGALLGALGEPTKSNMGVLMVLLGVFIICLVVIFMFSMHAILKTFLKKKLLQRKDSLFISLPGMKILLLQLDDSTTYHKSSKTSDDICLCLLDEQNQRLLLEGFNHRYIMRKEEVTGLHCIDIGHNPAVEVCFRIGEEDLAFVLHKGLSIGYISTTLFLNPMLVKSPSLKLYRQISHALDMSHKK